MCPIDLTLKHLQLMHFQFLWNNLFCYIFAPFSCIPKVLQKLVEDETTAVVIAPIWPTQNCLSPLLQLIAGQPYILPTPKHILFLPQNPKKIHPLRKMTLAAFLLSGKSSCVKTYKEKLPISLLNHGQDPPGSNTTPTYNKTASHAPCPTTGTYSLCISVV